MNKFYLFTKESCGPCGLVEKYIGYVKDDRKSIIERIDLDDFSNKPIPQENLDLAKKYGVTATPVLVIADTDGTKISSYTGGMEITQNIRGLLKTYAQSQSTL